MRLSKVLKDMSWREFSYLLAGIGPDTPLGRIVSIRAEDDREVLRDFTPEQRRIRNEWRQRKAKEMDPERGKEAAMRFLDAFKGMFT